MHDSNGRLWPARCTADNGRPDEEAEPFAAVLGQCEKRMVEISSLLPADSPRLGGENLEHARTLVESGADLPPILVNRSDMRVIDGMHRVRAAALRGADRIEAYLFSGSAEAAFILSVQANIKHGLPLTLREREVAAQRIVKLRPDWSDRAVAEASGISAKTVGALRKRVGCDLPQLHARVGRDGRVRPLNHAEGRRRASEMIRQNPDASLREIAQSVGISTGTARDVRERIRRGEDPLPPRQRMGEEGAAPQRLPAQRTVRSAAQRAVHDTVRMLQNLKKDPSLRFTDAGRALLRWLDVHALTSDECASLAASVPSHCTNVVAEVARGYAETWKQFAEELDDRGEATA
ncbi:MULTISPECIES: ParB/RepB/Spo0J family partition protein [Amycolatopsis]|uniref:ParB N-terminal domain-containing protein n=3 Tax=Amycolatopsis TaxID=1813 RepID=A0ABW5I5J5_9PSEU